MDIEELLLRWAVRIGVIFYVMSLLVRIGASPRYATARLLWTLGYLAVLLHYYFVFQFQHHWSGEEAYQAIAQQSKQDAGIEWGGGLYINYLFAIVWGIDVCWWWLNPTQYQKRSRAIELSIQLFLAFIVFNATVVFATGFSRWLGVFSVLAFGIQFVWRKCNRGKGIRQIGCEKAPIKDE